jgi:hypothetical protein
VPGHSQTATIPDAPASRAPLAPLGRDVTLTEFHRLTNSPFAIAAVATGARVVLGLVVSRLAVSVFPVRGFPLSSANPSTAGKAGMFPWDAAHYQSIASVGYPKGIPTLTPFFPLYPALGRGIESITGLGYQTAALIVSWACLFLATWGVVRLARNVLPASSVPARAGWLLCFFPASVFLIAGYAESTYIALFAWTLVFLSERRPWWAAGAACLAGLTRPDGAAIGLAVLVWCLMQPERRWLRTVALVAISEIGFIAFSIFLWARFGDPTEEFYVQKFWMRHLTWPFHPLVWSLNQVFGAHLTGPAAGNLRADYLLDDVSVVFAVAGLVVLMAMARHQRDLWWMLAPMLVAMVVVVANGSNNGRSPESDVRYVLCMVPLYLLPARFGKETAWTVTIVASTVLAVLYQVIFNLGGWFT